MLKKIKKILILSLLGTILLYAKEDNSSNIKQDTVNLDRKLDVSVESFQEIDFEVGKPPK